MTSYIAGEPRQVQLIANIVDIERGSILDFPTTLARLFNGANTGKQILDISSYVPRRVAWEPSCDLTSRVGTPPRRYVHTDTTERPPWSQLP